jgi:hypothetical protein
MVIGQDRTAVDQKVPKIRHLLQIRGHVWNIAAEVHIVELDIDNVLDSIVVGMQ